MKPLLIAIMVVALPLPHWGMALPGDFNSDGKVDFDDFFLFADAFGGHDPFYDLDSSGGIDFDDFFLFADNFGKDIDDIIPMGEVEVIGRVED